MRQALSQYNLRKNSRKTNSDFKFNMLWPIFSNNSQFNGRLDFIAFTLAAPDSSAKSSAGQCLVDVFTVTGQSNSVPAICGSNANQHSNIFFLIFLFFCKNCCSFPSVVWLSRSSLHDNDSWNFNFWPEHDSYWDFNFKAVEHQNHPDTLWCYICWLKYLCII